MQYYGIKHEYGFLFQMKRLSLCRWLLLHFLHHLVVCESDFVDVLKNEFILTNFKYHPGMLHSHFFNKNHLSYNFFFYYMYVIISRLICYLFDSEYFSIQQKLSILQLNTIFCFEYLFYATISTNIKIDLNQIFRLSCDH